MGKEICGSTYREEPRGQGKDGDRSLWREKFPGEGAQPTVSLEQEARDGSCLLLCATVPSASHNGTGWIVFCFALFNVKAERDLWESRTLMVIRRHTSVMEMCPWPSPGGSPLPWAQAGFSVHINSGIHRALGASGSFGLRKVMY